MIVTGKRSEENKVLDPVNCSNVNRGWLVHYMSKELGY